jgi:hypothetical protein
MLEQEHAAYFYFLTEPVESYLGGLSPITTMIFNNIGRNITRGKQSILDKSMWNNDVGVRKDI